MKQHALAGTYVQIHRIELTPEERTGKIPEDTRAVPLESWLKGFIDSDGAVGEEVAITTVTGRKTTGVLVDTNPTYHFGYGEIYFPELLQVGTALRNILKGDQ